MAERREDRAASAPVLDPGYVGRLEEQVGADVVVELFADGLVELSDRLDRLADAARDRERDSALALAHDLTSVAGHLGLARLSLTAADCQRVLRRPIRAICSASWNRCWPRAPRRSRRSVPMPACPAGGMHAPVEVRHNFAVPSR